MGVYQSGHGQHVGGVDDRGRSGRQAGSDLGDGGVIDTYVGFTQRTHRVEDGRPFDE